MELNQDQLSQLVTALAATSMANEELLAVLIATHPEPGVLQHVWQQASPERIDEEHERMLYQQGPYMQAFLSRMTEISGVIDGAAGQFLQND